MTATDQHATDRSGPRTVSDLARPDAVLLDIDGTLVDSNYLHVHAWTRALVDAELDVPAWRVHRAIGMDSSTLLDELLGDDAERLGPGVKDGHSEAYEQLTGLLRLLPGARELIAGLADDGVQVVLATSAPESELVHLREVLDVEADLAAVTQADDVETAKPAPDIVGVALERAGVPADRAVFVGDAVWDVKAAASAGVPCLGVLTGGISAAELRDAGALAVFRDVAALLQAVRTPSPGWLAPDVAVA